MLYLVAELLLHVVSERTSAEVEMPVRVREIALFRIVFEALDYRFDPETLRLTDLHETASVARKALRAIHALHYLPDLLFVLHVHEALLFHISRRFPPRTIGIEAIFLPI